MKKLIEKLKYDMGDGYYSGGCPHAIIVPPITGAAAFSVLPDAYLQGGGYATNRSGSADFAVAVLFNTGTSGMVCSIRLSGTGFPDLNLFGSTVVTGVWQPIVGTIPAANLHRYTAMTLMLSIDGGVYYFPVSDCIIDLNTRYARTKPNGASVGGSGFNFPLKSFNSFNIAIGDCINAASSGAQLPTGLFSFANVLQNYSATQTPGITPGSFPVNDVAQPFVGALNLDTGVAGVAAPAWTTGTNQGILFLDYVLGDGNGSNANLSAILNDFYGVLTYPGLSACMRNQAI